MISCGSFWRTSCSTYAGMHKAFIMGWTGFLGGLAFLTAGQHEVVGRQARLQANETSVRVRDMGIRAQHARELLGPNHGLTTTGSSQRMADFYTAIQAVARRDWKGHNPEDAALVAHAVLQESLEHDLDPVFLLAVIKRESRFNPLAIGSHGEIGLMQIRPNTAKWIAKKYNLPWSGNAMLKNPNMNIKIGAAYFSFLRKSFKANGGLYVSAYNMGPKKTREVIGKKCQPKVYANQVLANYLRFHTELRLLTDNAG